ncbi:MAG: hypothetical protein GYA55_05835, partial [SAR324 cluster bacterium]|nr:hypothetical protein [SAR324 cluster bacterium]
MNFRSIKFIRTTMSYSPLKYEKGVAILLWLIFISVGLLILGVFGSLAMNRLITAQLQTAADAAALAGAGVLGSSTKCGTGYCTATRRWEDARDLAVNTLRASEAYGSFDGSSTLDIEDEPDSESPVPKWTLPNSQEAKLEVTIERGRWLNEDEGFESFEGPWQKEHPGMPNFMAFNAVRVSISRKAVDIPFLSKLASGLLTARATSTSVISLPTPLPTAPMAIHVCALLNDSDDYDPKDLCLADRLFTATSQHCPAGTANCGNIPQFSWDPLPFDFRYCEYWNSFFNIPETSCPSPAVNQATDSENLNDMACFWASPRYQKPFDNYGLIGMPMDRQGLLTTPTEEEIRSAIEGVSTNVSIGGKFFVLEKGLKEIASEETIWRRIINKNNPAFNTITSLSPSTGVGNKININLNSYFTSSSSRSQCTLDSTTTKYYPKPSPTFWPGETGGTCNSRRSGWGHWNYFKTKGSGGNLIGFFNPEVAYTDAWTEFSNNTDLYQNHFGSLPIWEVSLAVIADADGSAMDCSDLSISTTPVGVGPYEIIGFVKAYIYDADIGREPPKFPDNSVKPFKTERGDWKYNSTSSFSNISSSDPSHPWGFTSPEGTPIPCNLIRARLACNQAILPAAQGGGETEISPVLVPE